MAQNYVEYHIVRGGSKTYPIKSGQTLKPGDIVTLDANGVSKTDGTKVPVGVVLAGTISRDYLGQGNIFPQLSGNTGDVATVVLKGMGSVVWLKAGGAITAGAFVKAGSDGSSVVPWVSGTDAEGLKLGIAETSATAGGDVIRVLMV